MKSHPYQQFRSVLFCPHPHQCLFSLVFLVIAILTGMREYLLRVLTCIVLVISHVEYIFVFLWAMCMSFWKK